ncbi:MAG TPA: S8 family serine peptidase [Pyrinomonadaceae bacterium]|nr:S8 family serine peptidase [Pyrinomonadaceae bacterium]
MSTYTKQKLLRCKGCGSAPVNETKDSRWWLPGVIVLELKKPVSPNQIFRPKDDEALQDLPVDAARLRKIVDPLLIKPPKWTFAFKKDQPPAVKDYERFITLHLQPDVNVPAIARELSNVGGVRRAAGEPRLAPPIRRIPFYKPRTQVLADMLTGTPETPLLGEPLALSGGDPRGRSMVIVSQQLQNQWYLFRSQVNGFLKTGLTGAGVVVADIDWGFKTSHQEFDGKIKYKFNGTNGGSHVSSGANKWHGTGTLGLIGAGDNNAGMLGFAPGADLWAIQGQVDATADPTADDNTSWARAIEEVRSKASDKRKVILIEASTGFSRNVESSLQISPAIIQAINSGCVVCVAAGNLGEDADYDPSGNLIPPTGSILVGATDYNDSPTLISRSDSNWGPRIVVSAPGAAFSDVTCCDCANNGYRNSFGGTSGAAAKVAGAMALLLERFPEIKHHEIVDVMKTKMTQITTADHPMGCFLDVDELISKTDEYLSEPH